MARCQGIFIGLGSNLDEPEQQVRRALLALGRLPDSAVLRASSLYRTPPWGEIEQPDFVNAVALIETALPPLQLLDALLGIEQAMGRVRVRRNGPRTIDLDLLMFGARRIDSPRLNLPHPRMHERAFVMLPLAEIAPALVVAGGMRADALASALDSGGIRRIEG